MYILLLARSSIVRFSLVNFWFVRSFDRSLGFSLFFSFYLWLFCMAMCAVYMTYMVETVYGMGIKCTHQTPNTYAVRLCVCVLYTFRLAFVDAAKLSGVNDLLSISACTMYIPVSLSAFLSPSLFDRAIHPIRSTAHLFFFVTFECFQFSTDRKTNRSTILVYFQRKNLNYYWCETATLQLTAAVTVYFCISRLLEFFRLSIDRSPIFQFVIFPINPQYWHR